MSPEVYRQAASVLVLRPSPSIPGEWDLLLLHKPRKNDAWQLPQGGMEHGETVIEAAMRELKEEASLTDCRVLGESTCVYQYDFPAGFRRFRPDNVKGQKICFVFALAKHDALVQVDAKEVDSFLWVKPTKLRSHIRRREYADLVEQLYREALSLV